MMKIAYFLGRSLAATLLIITSEDTEVTIAFFGLSWLILGLSKMFENAIERFNESSNTTGRK